MPTFYNLLLHCVSICFTFLVLWYGFTFAKGSMNSLELWWSEEIGDRHVMISCGVKLMNFYIHVNTRRRSIRQNVRNKMAGKKDRPIAYQNDLFYTVNNWTWWTDFYRYEAWSAACTRYYYLSLSIFTTKWKLKDCGTISSQGKVM